MKYIKEAISILKTRWPEAAILIILPVILAAFVNYSDLLSGEVTDGQQVIAIVIIVFFILTSILYLGFLRTSFTNKKQPQMPMELLKQGKRFFWRFIQLFFIYSAAYFLVGTVVFGFLQSMSPGAVNVEKINDPENVKALQETMQTAMMIANVLVSIVFMKFIIFLPALVIVNDMTVVSSFSLIRYCKLKDVKHVAVLFLVPVLIGLIWLIIPFAENQEFLAIIPTVVNQCLNLLVAVAAIRFVASAHLLYDNENQLESNEIEGVN